MQIDQSPVFRKVIVPWYDSDIVCVIIAIAMFVIFLFAVIGIRIASQYSEYHDDIWVPSLLAALSLIVCISTFIRWGWRHYSQR